MVPDKAGKPAITNWQVIGRRDNHALIAFRPETGRTHQLRVHTTLLSPGAAIVGDPVYGKAHPAGMMLHARSLIFPDPESGERKTAEAPCPGRFRAFGFG
jgi:tRNA pseudouridine32 synthase/23S rRNA pseudouridine746 synthase